MPIDRNPHTFCEITPLGKDAEDALRLPHNASKYIATEEGISEANTIVLGARDTPDPGFSQKGHIALTLDLGTFLDPYKGVVFGSDPDRCDVLLHPEKSTVVSALHFVLQFAWKAGPDPSILILVSLSRNGVGVNNEKLPPNQKLALVSNRTYFIDVVGRHFVIQVVDWSDNPNRSKFEARWNEFIREVHYKAIRNKAPIEDGDSEQTPWQPVGPEAGYAVRYMPFRDLVHCEDLCAALTMPMRTFKTLAKRLKFTLQTVKRLNSDRYLALEDALKLCSESEAGRQGALELTQAVIASGATAKTFLTVLHIAFSKSGGPSSAGSYPDIGCLDSISRPHFDPVSVIHNGPCSEVRKMVERTTGRLVAVKCIRAVEGDKAWKNSMQELKFLTTLRHPRLVEVESVMAVKGGWDICMPFFRFGDLHQHANRNGPFTETYCMRYVDQVLDTLEFLHGNGLAHRDLKPANILISSLEPLDVKLADLGLIKDLQADAQQVDITFAGTPSFMAPETWTSGSDPTQGRPDGKVDVWALGVTLWYTLCFDYPFELESSKNPPMFHDRPDFRPLKDKTLSKEILNILELMLTIKPSDRPSAADLRRHPWVTGKTVEEGAHGERSKRHRSDKGKGRAK